MGNSESAYDPHHEFHHQTPSYAETSMDPDHQQRRHTSYIADNFDSLDQVFSSSFYFLIGVVWNLESLILLPLYTLLVKLFPCDQPVEEFNIVRVHTTKPHSNMTCSFLKMSNHVKNEISDHEVLNHKISTSCNILL